MTLQKNFKEIVEWSLKSEENREKALNGAHALIALLNATGGKKISDVDIDGIMHSKLVNAGSWVDGLESCCHGDLG